MNLFGARVKMFRENLNLTQDELAKRLGYSSGSSIAKIETGALPVPAKKVTSYAKALGVTVPELLGSEDATPVSLDNAIGMISELETMQNIMKMLSSMDVQQLKKAENILKLLMED